MRRPAQPDAREGQAGPSGESDRLIVPGKPLIPVLNGYDAASYFLEAADGEASTSPKVDLFMYQLSSNPMP